LLALPEILHAMSASDPADRSDVLGIEDEKDSTELTLPSTIWNSITHSADLWGQFKYLTKLDLNNNGLITLPSCLGALPSLEILFLSENNFDAIPECIGNMRKLRMLSLRGNRLTELSTSNLPSQTLIWLILTNNRICNIDPNVRELKLVRKLMLSHNKLTSIPKELGECKNLELIRLANNEIDSPLPIEFLTLQKLAWISLAGNPIARCPQSTEKVISKSKISFDESTILGRGASGTVYLGKYQDKDVAVKIFKQER
jgi:Leucine-rich repeat (LRR) protein